MSGISPASGTTAGGTSVTISGTGFVSGATVTVGGAAATSVTVANTGTSITATTPAHTAGTVSVSVTNPDNQSATLPNGFTYVAPNALPSPWLNTDVGVPAVPGSATYSSGTFTLQGKGTDLFGTSEAFHFVYRPMPGDGTIIARVDSIANATDEFAMAGVMIRDSLAPNAAHASMVVMPSFSGRAKFRYRLTTGADTSSSGPGAGGVALPQWVKLVRTGSTIQGFYSADGVTWKQDLIVPTSVNISFGPNAVMGLVLTSHDNTTLVTTTISNVSP